MESSFAWELTNQGPGVGTSVFLSQVPLALGVNLSFPPKNVLLWLELNCQRCPAGAAQCRPGQAGADWHTVKQTSTGQSGPAWSRAELSGWERGHVPQPSHPRAASMLFQQLCCITIEQFAPNTFSFFSASLDGGSFWHWTGTNSHWLTILIMPIFLSHRLFPLLEDGRSKEFILYNSVLTCPPMSLHAGSPPTVVRGIFQNAKWSSENTHHLHFVSRELKQT